MPKFGASLDYVELASARISESQAFFSKAFGWDATYYGPGYAAVTAGTSEIGLNGHAEADPVPLLLIRVDDVEAALRSVIAAGGTITRQIQRFPGGRRFHFREPSGTQLGVYQNDA